MDVVRAGMTTVGFLLVAGTAIGTALGLLMAPQPGYRTRQQFRRYSRQARSRAERIGRGVRTNVDRAISYGRSLVD